MYMLWRKLPLKSQVVFKKNQLGFNFYTEPKPVGLVLGQLDPYVLTPIL